VKLQVLRLALKSSNRNTVICTWIGKVNESEKEMTPSNNSSYHNSDVASMAAARNPSKTAPASASRDGFDLIPRVPIVWDDDCTVKFHFQDITYHKSTADMCSRIAFNRPSILHAFRPTTIREIQRAVEDSADDINVGVIILTSNIFENNYTPAFCAGGDQTVRSDEAGGYQDGTEQAPAKLRVLDLQVQMRRCPKPVLCIVRGYAIGGGHILHMCADLTLASKETAVFGQTGPRMGSFDAGYGCSIAADLIGQKRARELWFLCRYYDATEAASIGLINACYPEVDLDGRAAQWVRRMIHNSPTAIACCKASLNAHQDGAAGVAQLGGELTRLFYLSKESAEGRHAYLERRAPNFRSKL
jgi:naphthoate synthase